MELTNIFKKVKAASRKSGQLTDKQRNDILSAVADAIVTNNDLLLKANAVDLEKMDRKNPLYDRLMLTEQRLKGIAADMRHVATLPSPLGIESKHRTLDNGLRLKRISVPFGVIGVIYEARPNVTFDVFALCLKSGNACILKGGKGADNSCRAAIRLIHNVLEEKGFDKNIATLLPATHEATAEMLGAVGYIDVCIPRGGRKLIDFVRNTAKVPVIETGAGVVNTYLDKDADITMAAAIVENGKTRRCSVCNALDCLIVHSDRLQDLHFVCSPLAQHEVTIFSDKRAYKALEGRYPAPLLQHADNETYGTEFMAMKMAIRTVDNIDEALDHIQQYGSGHSEAIITQNDTAARLFQQSVDAACVYWNAPTSFTDGAQFGLGAEIGISTQKLGPRGPMALEEMTTYKWIIEGEGQVRPK